MTIHVRKEALLQWIADDEAGKEDASLPIYSTPVEVRSAFASEFGLHPSFLTLLIELAAGDAGFWRKAIEKLPPEAATRLIVTRWIEWLWSDSEIGFRERIDNPELRACGDAVCRLHYRAAAGEAVSRAEWRSVRFALGNPDSEEELQAAVAAVAAAAAWDLDTVPGAASDMIYAWKTALFTEIDRDLGWNEEKEAAANERSAAAATAGQVMADADRSASNAEGEAEDPASSPRYRELYQKGMNEYLAVNPSDLDRRHELRYAKFMEAAGLAREGFLRQIERSGSQHRPEVVA